MIFIICKFLICCPKWSELQKGQKGIFFGGNSRSKPIYVIKGVQNRGVGGIRFLFWRPEVWLSGTPIWLFWSFFGQNSQIGVPESHTSGRQNRKRIPPTPQFCTPIITKKWFGMWFFSKNYAFSAFWKFWQLWAKFNILKMTISQMLKDGDKFWIFCFSQIS